jgi:hypothetical protein
VPILACLASASFAFVDIRPVGQVVAGGEITAYDRGSARLFTVNGATGSIDIVDLREPWNPKKIGAIDVGPYGAAANSVAVHDGLVAVAVEADDKQAPGRVVFFDVAGVERGSVTVGSLPDSLTFTPDGSKIVVANEGEPRDYCAPGLANDPMGTISIIDLSAGPAAATVATAGFGGFATVPDGVRIFGPNATIAQDLEPEYVATDGATAWVTLQENNALAVVNIATATVSAVVPLGTKDHSRPENAFDASDRDDAIRIQTWPVVGMFNPDSIVPTRDADGNLFLLTANEGDARDYECFAEEERVKDLELDPTAYPNAAVLQEDENLGRLTVTTATGDSDGDGDIDQIHAFGARSFSVWDASGALVWDSGRDLEIATAARFPRDFNSGGVGTDDFDGRSDNKGPEPEGLAVGFFRGRRLAFIGLERIGGVAVYDVTDPRRPSFCSWATNVAEDGSPLVGGILDRGPEGILFIPKGHSPIDRALLVVSHEVSGTLTIFAVTPALPED